ncbi:MAG TPA: serine hydrolase, partial [Thermoanaerobaculia bacterium]|nr:serine hydrolase [Thermoanaerobaculia bacterium]
DRKLKIHFDPGTHYAYSGEGIDLLQRVVETITGEPLETLMQREVFRPLGMKRTSMIWQAPFGSDFANGYDEYSRSLGPQRRKRADAAGSLQTTLRDFTRFVQAVLAGEGLSKRAHAEMLSPQIRILSRHEFPTFEPQMTDINQRIRLSYGLGWGLYWTPYGKAFFKEGHDDGWRNYVVAFERSGDGIVIMTNSGNGEGIFEDLLETLLGNRYTPIEWERFTPYDQLPPRAPLPVHTRVSIDPALLEKCAGVYAIGPNKLVMRRSGDHLTVQENDEPMQELLPQSATEFFSTVADDVYRFETGPDGRVTRVVLITGDEQIPIPRTP